VSTLTSHHFARVAVPDKRKHRGPAPADEALFNKAQQGRLARATAHLSWLFDHDYSEKASVKLVGDRFKLLARQRIAIRRCAAPKAAVEKRSQKRRQDTELIGENLHVDGFNVLTSIEAALSKGVLLIGRDSCLRDMASMHGSYRRVQETAPALELIRKSLASLKLKKVTWYLDKPVSNSGRLAAIIRDHAERNDWNCQLEVQLVPDPDKILIGQTELIASADRLIIDNGPGWFNLAAYIIEKHCKDSWILDLSQGSIL
jgi:hypothetical protein